MGTIETTIDQSRDLTIVEATGTMTAHDFREWIADDYVGAVTQLMVWDLTHTDMSNISITDILKIVTYLKEVAADKRKEGKTVFVADRDGIAVPLSRYQQVFLDMSDIGIKMKAFYHMSEAVEWLGL